MTDVAASPASSEAPQAPVEFRSSNLADVKPLQRIIEVIAAPYDQPAQIEYRGEIWNEVFVRGAWDGIEKRPNRVRANRDHDVKRLVGRVVNFWPSREEGLVAAVKIAPTPLGDETLALADDECLSASVGFAVMGSGQELDRRTRTRRIKQAYMAHLAFTPEPAYQGAEVLDVRSAGSPGADMRPMVETPALDELLEFMRSLKR